MEFSKEQLRQVEELSSIFCSICEIAMKLDVDEKLLRRTIRNRNSEISIFYNMGKLDTQINLRKQIKLFAEKGSPQAQQFMSELYEKQIGNE